MSDTVFVCGIDEITTENHICYLYFKMNADKLQRAKEMFSG